MCTYTCRNVYICTADGGLGVLPDRRGKNGNVLIKHTYIHTYMYACIQLAADLTDRQRDRQKDRQTRPKWGHMLMIHISIHKNTHIHINEHIHTYIQLPADVVSYLTDEAEMRPCTKHTYIHTYMHTAASGRCLVPYR